MKHRILFLLLLVSLAVFLIRRRTGVIGREEDRVGSEAFSQDKTPTTYRVETRLEKAASKKATAAEPKPAGSSSNGGVPKIEIGRTAEPGEIPPEMTPDNWLQMPEATRLRFGKNLIAKLPEEFRRNFIFVKKTYLPRAAFAPDPETPH